MRILSIQSSVAYGHVGNSAAVFPLQRLGHEVWPVFTVHFSNHTGYGAWRGPLLAADDVREVITGIEERGVLGEVDVVLSGYQGGEDIGDVILDAVARVKAANPAATYTCDPVMGNARSGCFVNPAIPILLRERVVPAADLITPNQFELGFLTGTEPDDLESTLASVDAARAMGPSARPGHQRRATRRARPTPSRCWPSPTTAPGSCRPRGSRSRPTAPATSPPPCSPRTTARTGDAADALARTTSSVFDLLAHHPRVRRARAAARRVAGVLRRPGDAVRGHPGALTRSSSAVGSRAACQD